MGEFWSDLLVGRGTFFIISLNTAVEKSVGLTSRSALPRSLGRAHIEAHDLQEPPHLALLLGWAG